ncbi:hypothetical protein SeMB42_g07190 [Synchytrium endobioticum]|uniref:Uncharacterized protein n=1 Tax=Synchytrium endobioticum TaxID=286115 RepID=A0A507CBK5_9FUNG|nr:hypothetical protein SeMB42_g07190 [Synchytrium endobioticum]
MQGIFRGRVDIIVVDESGLMSGDLTMQFDCQSYYHTLDTSEIKCTWPSIVRSSVDVAFREITPVRVLLDFTTTYLMWPSLDGGLVTIRQKPTTVTSNTTRRVEISGRIGDEGITGGTSWSTDGRHARQYYQVKDMHRATND